MKSHLQSTDYALWGMVEKVYAAPEAAPTDEEEFKVFQLNLNAVRILRKSLDEKVFDKIGNLGSAKEI